LVEEIPDDEDETAAVESDAVSESADDDMLPDVDDMLE